LTPALSKTPKHLDPFHITPTARRYKIKKPLTVLATAAFSAGGCWSAILGLSGGLMEDKILDEVEKGAL